MVISLEHMSFYWLRKLEYLEETPDAQKECARLAVYISPISFWKQNQQIHAIYLAPNILNIVLSEIQGSLVHVWVTVCL